MPFTCANFAKAVTDKSRQRQRRQGSLQCVTVNRTSLWDKTFFQIRVGNDTHNFLAKNGTEAKTIVESVRVDCKLDQQGKKR